MELTTREDIEAPLDRVFAEAADFDRLERQVTRRGIELRRTGGAERPGAGLSWRAGFRLHGKPRDAEIVLTEYDPPNAMVYHTASGGLEARTVIDFVALSRTRTRVGMKVELVPKTLSARLLVQSMKIARGNIEQRFRAKIADFARDIETRLKRAG